MKYMFIIILALISTQSFADTELHNCVIHYKMSNETISQACIKKDLKDRNTFLLTSIDGSPLGDDTDIAVIRGPKASRQLITRMPNGEIYDLGVIRKDIKRPGCYDNRYYTICLK